jgi:AcrR family transcriptional regulator
MNVSKHTGERTEQKERTRQKLLAAARLLVEEGTTLTVARAAEKAAVAEATAYRYYRNPRSLLRDALAVEWPNLDDLLTSLTAMPSPADRAQRAAEELARFVLAREAGIRLLFAATGQEPRDPDSDSGLPSTSFRRRLVEAVLHGEKTSDGEIRSIRLALLVVISPHAVLTLRDTTLLGRDDIAGELGRMARRLFGGPNSAG